MGVPQPVEWNSLTCALGIARCSRASYFRDRAIAIQRCEHRIVVLPRIGVLRWNADERDVRSARQGRRARTNCSSSASSSSAPAISDLPDYHQRMPYMEDAALEVNIFPSQPSSSPCRIPVVRATSQIRELSYSLWPRGIAALPLLPTPPLLDGQRVAASPRRLRSGIPCSTRMRVGGPPGSRYALAGLFAGRSYPSVRLPVPDAKPAYSRLGSGGRQFLEWD